MDSKTWNSNLNTRNIKADEIAAITGHPTFKQASATTSEWFYFGSNDNKDSSLRSNYSWLYNYTNKCMNYGCDVEYIFTNGYWTQDMVANSTTNAWYVVYEGYLGNYSVGLGDRGVRPVITIQK